MKFTVFLILLPVALAIPSSKRAGSCVLQNPSCNELSEKCAADVYNDLAHTPRQPVPAGFHAHKFATCIATAACMGSPSTFRGRSCIGQEFPFDPKAGFQDISPEVLSQITNCSGDDCSITAQNFIDLIYSQLSTNWPESAEFVLNTWWASVVKQIVPGTEDPAHATIPAKLFNNWFSVSVFKSIPH